MGTVWAARQVGKFKRLVALKLAHDNLAVDEEYRNMFLDEARLASLVQHPNVCSVIDMGEERGRLYLVMDWMGCSLRELLAKVPGRLVAPRIAARIIADAAAGLHGAHELCDENGKALELIHRDISPDNILFALDGRVKVTDFGVARARDQIHKRTATGEMKGKMSYMAPEQIMSKTYDRRVDIFALGCVLYRAAVGKKAFSGTNATIIYDILESRYARPHEVNPEFPPGLEAILLKAMAFRAEDRYATADELNLALEGWLTEAKTPATSVEVGALVRETLSVSLEERAERVRTATAEVEKAEAAQKATEGQIPIDVNEEEATQAVDLKAISGSTPLTTGGTTSESFAVMAKQTEKRPRWLAWGAPIVLLAAVGGFAVVEKRRSRPPVEVSNVAPPPSVTAPTASASSGSTTIAAHPEGPAPVTLSVRATPAHAVLVIDEAAPVGLPFRGEFPRDGKKHRIVVEAPGFRSDARVVTFDESREMVLTLRPMASGQGVTATPAVTPPTNTSVAPPHTAPTGGNEPPMGTPLPTGTKKKHNIDRDLGD
jgi:serine/threonine-protein kinase